VTIIFIF